MIRPWVLAAISLAVAVTVVGVVAFRAVPGPSDPLSESAPQVTLTCRTGDPDRPCAFVPDVLTIRPGTAVRWTNDEAVFHTITSTDSLDVLRPNGVFDHSVSQEGESFEFLFLTPGTYPYYCQAHAEFMTGTVVVTG